jgi:hypothetical protein
MIRLELSQSQPFFPVIESECRDKSTARPDSGNSRVVLVLYLKRPTQRLNSQLFARGRFRYSTKTSGCQTRSIAFSRSADAVPGYFRIPRNRALIRSGNSVPSVRSWKLFALECQNVKGARMNIPETYDYLVRARRICGLRWRECRTRFCRARCWAVRRKGGVLAVWQEAGRFFFDPSERIYGILWSLSVSVVLQGEKHFRDNKRTMDWAMGPF